MLGMYTFARDSHPCSSLTCRPCLRSIIFGEVSTWWGLTGSWSNTSSFSLWRTCSLCGHYRQGSKQFEFQFSFFLGTCFIFTKLFPFGKCPLVTALWTDCVNCVDIWCRYVPHLWKARMIMAALYFLFFIFLFFTDFSFSSKRQR